MKTLIAVMNARRMPEVLAALNSVEIDTVWMTGFWEIELNKVMREVVDRAEKEGYSHIALVSDDIVVSEEAISKVLRLSWKGYLAVTAYCDMFRGSPDVNITKQPFSDYEEPFTKYHLYTLEEVNDYPHDVVPTWFMGWSFSLMPIALWKEIPFAAMVGNGAHDKGWASDWHTSTRLSKAKIPIVSPRGAFMRHLKAAPGAPLTMKRPTRYDIARWRRETPALPGAELLMGKIEKEVRWEYKT